MPDETDEQHSSTRSVHENSDGDDRDSGEKSGRQQAESRDESPDEADEKHSSTRRVHKNSDGDDEDSSDRSGDRSEDNMRRMLRDVRPHPTYAMRRDTLHFYINFWRNYTSILILAYFLDLSTTHKDYVASLIGSSFKIEGS